MSVKIGLSTYSLQQEIDSGRMTLPEVLTWMGEQGADHAELVPFSYTLIDNQPLIDAALAAERFDLCLNLVAGAIPEEAPQPGEEASAAAVKRLEAFIAQQ